MFICDIAIFGYSFAAVSCRMFPVGANISGQVLDVVHAVLLNCELQ